MILTKQKFNKTNFFGSSPLEALPSHSDANCSKTYSAFLKFFTETNVSIDVSEIDLKHVEEEVFKEDLADVRKFTADATQDVRSMYRHTKKAAEKGLMLKDILSEGMKVGDNYWYVPGGHWIPASCIPRWKVAIIIPFRDRFVHLPIILRHLVPFLKEQYLEFGIFFVEQLLTIPNGTALYSMTWTTSLSAMATSTVAVECQNISYLVQIDGVINCCTAFFFGAVTGFTRSQVADFNGFPNTYWGWGGEDDDILGRMRSVGLFKTRPWGQVGFYNVIPHHHKSAPKNKNRVCLLNHYKQRLSTDGLVNLKYGTPRVTLLPLYTNISVDIQHLPWNEQWLDCKEDA
ncbi:hypothetical protein BSL78_21792 [Apostichopus japonicus]|uniref:Beta-1,4-galactosyltransferase n=1 Tax=Stichopus japonicus TaxID=307972 RepID=A0A2G8K040_STIJA|nr:hypothetical protein BSL78_21792 [Apostichopus japonicus]